LEIVAGKDWHTWLRAKDGRLESLTQDLACNFFQSRYDGSYFLSVATTSQVVEGGCAQEQLVGVACFSNGGWTDRELRWELVAIEVSPPARRKEVGRKLILKFARLCALGKDATPNTKRPIGRSIFVRSWFSNAVPFYLRVGFTLRRTNTRSISDLAFSDEGVYWMNVQ
jgi:GNAT superfamily N-acetyltransferase